MPPLVRRVPLVFLGLVMASFNPLLAQGLAGRIEGRVTDRGGMAVPSVRVLIVGTTSEAVTDDGGRYAVAMSAGSYLLRLRRPGYATRDIAGVRVEAGQTATVNVTLLSVAAPGPIGPGDAATSRSVLDGAAFHDLPVVDPRDAIALQPGVIETGDSRGLVLRGAEPGAAALFVDGALIPSASLGTNAIEEAAITTGALGAEIGEGRAGAISFVTRAGGSRWQGGVRYRTDDVGVNAGGSIGFHRVEASLGGPLRPNVTVFTALTVHGQQSLDAAKDRDALAPVYVMSGVDTVVHQPATWGAAATDTALVTIPRFVQSSGDCAASSNFSVSCQGLRVPFTATGSYAWQAKLQHTYGTASRVSLTGLTSRLQQRDFPGANLYNPSDYTGTARHSRAAILSWSQDLGRLRSGPLALDLNLSYQRVEGIAGPLTRASELDTRDPFGGFLLQPLEYLFDSDYH